jgi:beta-glucosidase
VTDDLPAFPDGFVWGAATAAYQIEGAVDAGGRGPSIWDTFSHTEGATYRGDTGDNACRHHERLEEDLDLMADLGLAAYRFSIAWPRIQPDGTGPANAEGVAFYQRLVDGLHARGITPFATLYHWDLPQALQDAGGWGNRDTAARFAAYAGLIAGELDGIEHWATLNEPWVAAFVGHGSGRHAPGIADGAAAVRAAHHLLLAHGLAVPALRDAGAGDVGIVLNLSAVRPASEGEPDRRAAQLVDGHANRWFLDPVLRGTYPDDVRAAVGHATDLAFVVDGDLDAISAPIDFLGINYYFPTKVRAGATPDRAEQVPLTDVETVPPQLDEPTTAMGWPIDATGLTEVLTRVTRDYGDVPLYITENGIAVHDYVDPEGVVNDVERIAYLRDHLAAVAAAMEAGSPVRGYFCWSLLDNFEWSEGYAKRFGLIHVDYPTGRRTPKASAAWYRDVIAGR